MNRISSTLGEPAPGGKGSGMPPWVSRELAGADRAVLLIIFLEQFFLSISLFWLAALMPDKGGRYSLVVLFGLWGLISAFGLGFIRLLPRILALLWHVTFIGAILVRHINEGNSTRASNASQWVLYDSLAVLYLAVTAFLQYRNGEKKKNEVSH
jgi:hypothetical protein